LRWGSIQTLFSLELQLGHEKREATMHFEIVCPLHWYEETGIGKREFKIKRFK